MSDKMSSPRRDRGVAPNRTRWRSAGCAVGPVLLLVVLVVAVVVWGPRVQTLIANQTAAVPTVLEDRTSPEELAAHRQEAVVQLSGYGWVDQEAGVAHIPIERAITLVAETGLPVGTEARDATGAEAAPPAEAAPAVDLADVNFQDHVLPIFEERCGECHGSEDPEEQLELTRYRTALIGSLNGPVIVPGDPDDSYLVEQIVSGQMPKRDDPLPPAEIEIIIAWIEAGAPEN